MSLPQPESPAATSSLVPTPAELLPRSVRIRHALNWLNGSTLLGMGVATAGGAAVRPGPRKLYVAEHYRWRFPTGGAFTVGDVVITRHDIDELCARRPDLLEHEDLFDGSHVVEARTAKLREAAQAELDRVLQLGGAVAAVDNAYMKQRLVESHTARVRAIESGDLSLDDCETLLGELECESIKSRAGRLRSLVAPMPLEANDAALRDETADFAGFRDRWENPALHAVFTAHPTFLLPPAQTHAVAQAASSDAPISDAPCAASTERRAASGSRA